MVSTKTPRPPNHLKAIREARGLSQNAVAARAGLKQAMLWRFETALNEPKGLRSAHAIAAALDVDVFAIWPHLRPAASEVLPQPAPQHRRPEPAVTRRKAPSGAAKNQGKTKR